MITVPASLSNEISKLRGRRLEGRVIINYSSVYGDDLIDSSTNTQNNASHIDQVYNGKFDVSAKYVSLDGLWELDGTYVLPPETEAEKAEYEMGWWSGRLPKPNKTFGTGGRVLYGTKLYGSELYSDGHLQPSLVLYFPARTVQNINIAFDNARMEYAGDFDIIFYSADGTILHTENVTGNTGTRYSKAITAINLCTKMVMIIKTWSVVSNAKVAEMLTSIQETYNGPDLFNIQVVEGIDERSQMSSGRCVVSLYNKFRKFDYENTTSALFNQIRRGVRVEPFIGDGTNWVPLGVFYAEAWDIRRRDMRVTVTAVDKVALLQRTQFADNKIIEKPADDEILIDDDADWLAGTYTGVTVDGGITLS